MSDRAFRSFIEKHDEAKVGGLWWCSGSAWEYRVYHVVLVARVSGWRTRVQCVEFTGTTPRVLAAKIKKVGCVPPSLRTIGRLCHSAPISPRQPRRRAA